MSKPLALQLHPPGAELPGGSSVHAVGGAAASLRLDAGHTELHVAMADRSLAEQRWILDQLVRKVADLARFEGASLRAAPEIPDDALLTVALDLHHRTGGRLEVLERAAIREGLSRAGALEDGVRAWVNEDPKDRTSIAIASDVDHWASGRNDVEVEIFAEEELRERGLRLLLAVGQGGRASPSRLVMARYAPGGSLKDPLMFLGKGITFDTGGINVKPYEAFVSTMKNDMAGAAMAFHLFRGLVESGSDRPAVLVIPTCENAIGSGAMRPGSLVQSYRGPMVRIDHTDAEGRLVLADGLAYATDTFAPSQVLCFATLTTAALIAYGPYATPVHFASDELRGRLEAASETLGEDLHFFPERVWHFEANRDREADVRNTARLPADASRGAGSRNAAHFLKHFSDAPLCHFDIFGSAWNWAQDAPGAGYGATGAPLRTLLRAFEIV